jgi:hypothetical protein
LPDVDDPDPVVSEEPVVDEPPDPDPDPDPLLEPEPLFVLLPEGLDDEPMFVPEVFAAVFLVLAAPAINPMIHSAIKPPTNHRVMVLLDLSFLGDTGLCSTIALFFS